MISCLLLRMSLYTKYLHGADSSSDDAVITEHFNNLHSARGKIANCRPRSVVTFFTLSYCYSVVLVFRLNHQQLVENLTR